MLHMGRHVIETAGSQQLELAIVFKGRCPLNDGVRFVGAVPVHRNVHFPGRTDQQLRGLG